MQRLEAVVQDSHQQPHVQRVLEERPVICQVLRPFMETATRATTARLEHGLQAPMEQLILPKHQQVASAPLAITAQKVLLSLLLVLQEHTSPHQE